MKFKFIKKQMITMLFTKALKVMERGQHEN